jgi:nucleoside 2-deoxyribosyltransferase
MIVTGGTYRELCARPRWQRIFGSGGRAIAAVAKLSLGSELHSYANSDWIPSLDASAAACGYKSVLMPIGEKITFEYLHPLSRPGLFPPKRKMQAALRVAGEAVLRFDFVEGDAIVDAGRAVYDPQTGGKPKPFFENGSKCRELAVVLNAKEASLATELDVYEAGPALIRDWKADIVVIKLGTQGAVLFQREGPPQDVPAFRSDRVFKIGSGDVFSAIFAHCWAELGMDPLSAATHASVAVAQYVETRTLPFTELPQQGDRLVCHKREIQPVIYLAGPFFDVAQRWLIEESMALLEGLGAEVFSPIHHVGYAENAHNVALEDLKGLEEADVVLALADSKDAGTLFEVGYARALKKPVVVLAERFHKHDFTMFEGTDCFVTDDFTTALYRSVWAAS